MEIMNRIGTWCGSVAGVLTILILLITFGRLIMTLLREKHGKDSLLYRTVKGFPTIICVIYVINMVAHLCGRVTSSISTAASSATEAVLAQQWMTVTVWLLAYCILIWLAGSLEAGIFMWAAAVLGVVGSYAIWHNGWATFGIGFVALIVNAAVIDCMPKSATFFPHRRQMNVEENLGKSVEKRAHHGLLFGILWLASLVMAYLAGEYSLVPRGIELLNNKVNKKSKTSKPASSEEVEAISRPAEQPIV